MVIIYYKCSSQRSQLRYSLQHIKYTCTKSLFYNCLRFTAKYVSPRLTTDEIEQIQMSSTLSSADNLTVKVRSASREIIATYTLEEFTIELLIVLPSNYPVGVTSVECSKKLGVATNEWRKWMLQLTTFLTYQVRWRSAHLSIMYMLIFVGLCSLCLVFLW